LHKSNERLLAGIDGGNAGEKRESRPTTDDIWAAEKKGGSIHIYIM